MTLREQLIELLQSGSIELTATQDKLSFPIIERIYKKMRAEIQFRSIQVVKGAIIDGHHRYIASLLAGYTLDRIKSIRSSAKRDIEWSAVEIVNNDLEDPEDIRKLNEQDARFSGMTLEELLEKIK